MIACTGDQRNRAAGDKGSVQQVVHIVAERSVAGYYAALLLSPSGGPDL